MGISAGTVTRYMQSGRLYQDKYKFSTQPAAQQEETYTKKFSTLHGFFFSVAPQLKKSSL